MVKAMLRPLYPREGDLVVPFVQEAGWAPGPVWTGAVNYGLTGIRSTDLPAGSESLYRVRSIGPLMALYLGKTCSIFQYVIFHVL
jgi:hypothetical protein